MKQPDTESPRINYILSDFQRGQDGEIPIFMLNEPPENEIERLRPEDLQDKQAMAFAYNLSLFGESVDTHDDYSIQHYEPYHEERDGSYYRRYSQRDHNLGLVLTDIEMDRIRLTSNGEPELWQMGPERRRMALIQRADYFRWNQSEKTLHYIDMLEKGYLSIPRRANRRHPAVDYALQCYVDEESGHEYSNVTVALEEIGYFKESSTRYMSRTESALYGTFNKVGKRIRRIIGLGSMPPVSGGEDAIVTAAIGHMVSFIPRNSIYAGNIDRQIHLAQAAKKRIRSIGLSDEQAKRAEANIGVSLGCENPEQTLKDARRLYHEGGVKLFRIYSINSDRRFIETARLLRQEFGDDIEIFAGQIADKKQALRLIADDIRINALIFGHGGGRQCTSAENGMVVSTLQQIYKIAIDERFNNTTIMVEGAVGKNIGTMLILGVDCILYNQRIMHGCIESPAGDLYIVEKKSGKLCQPYPGSASPVTQLIEGANPDLREKRIDASGRTRKPEGKPGFMFFTRKAASMGFWIHDLLNAAGRAFADLDAINLIELRQRQLDDDTFRPLSFNSMVSRETGSAYRDTK